MVFSIFEPKTFCAKAFGSVRHLTLNEVLEVLSVRSTRKTAGRYFALALRFVSTLLRTP
nr:MAG TPA_asm: hypothetical protein [Caudoviricetes sp.]